MIGCSRSGTLDTRSQSPLRQVYGNVSLSMCIRFRARSSDRASRSSVTIRCGRPFVVCPKSGVTPQLLLEQIRHKRRLFQVASQRFWANRVLFRWKVVTVALGHSEGRGAKRAWQDIAEEVIKERDPNRLVKLVGELNNALDAERHHQPSKAGPPPCE